MPCSTPLTYVWTVHSYPSSFKLHKRLVATQSRTRSGATLFVYSISKREYPRVCIGVRSARMDSRISTPVVICSNGVHDHREGEPSHGSREMTRPRPLTSWRDTGRGMGRIPELHVRVPSVFHMIHYNDPKQIPSVFAYFQPQCLQVDVFSTRPALWSRSLKATPQAEERLPTRTNAIGLNVGMGCLVQCPQWFDKLATGDRRRLSDIWVRQRSNDHLFHGRG